MAKQATARPLDRERSIGQALKLHQQGRLGEADRIYRAILAADPQDFDALHLLGVLEHQQGRSVDGLRLVAAALRAQPGSAAALANYGVILDVLKRHEEALAAFDRLLGMGAADATLHFNRGNALNNLQRYADALASYDAALALAPSHTDALYNRGNVLAALDRHEEALASYDRALAFAPERDVHVNRAATLLKLQRYYAALESADKALASDANSVAALNNRGTILTELKRYDEALASLDRVLALDPDHADAHNNRGVALAELGRYEEALAHYAHALRVAPNFVYAHINRGNAFRALLRMEEALESYAAALALDPHNADADFNDGLARLCAGDFREGWKKYERRWQKTKNAVPRPSYPQPMWRGEGDLRGKTILLVGEQGMGDAIQFARYAPHLAALGAKVLLRVDASLAALMTTLAGVSKVIGAGEALPHFDFYCPLLSLPLAFGTELATVPASVPYLRAPQERVAKWRARLPHNGRLRIGLCWAGSPQHLHDRRRSLPLERFATLLSVPGLDFVSLQKDLGASDAALLREHRVSDLGPELADFADAAAVIAMLDVIISVDTSVAHLAGAMGKAVGLLLPYSPDFRWLLGRMDSPWYPTMRLFRQSAIGDWDGVLQRLRQELANLACRPVAPASAVGGPR
jgi:tetratricopeptide (TPR) repeat protein